MLGEGRRKGSRAFAETQVADQARQGSLGAGVRWDLDTKGMALAETKGQRVTREKSPLSTSGGRRTDWTLASPKSPMPLSRRQRKRPGRGRRTRRSGSSRARVARPLEMDRNLGKWESSCLFPGDTGRLTLAGRRKRRKRSVQTVRHLEQCPTLNRNLIRLFWKDHTSGYRILNLQDAALTF